MLALLKIFSRFLAVLPVALVALFCRAMAVLVYFLMPRRRASTMRSLHHAFPGQSEGWRRRVFRRSTAHLFEMGLFRPVSAYFSEARMHEVLEIPPETERLFRQYENGQPKHGRPVVILLPHMTMSEAATFLPHRFPKLPMVHVIFRPLNQPSISKWVTSERERFGAKMISRRSGYNDAMAALRRGEVVAVLFDQDASKKGTTITFMDRVVSATDLPGLLAHRFNADVFVFLLERTGFWKARLTVKEISLGESPSEVTVRSHQALAEYLRRDAVTAADWLWLHERWDHYYNPRKRFRLPNKRNQIELSNRILGHDSTPRATRLWVRLPNWLGDVVMALPVLRAIRAARPDFEFTLIGKEAFRPLIERLGVADHFIPLPGRGRGYFKAFYNLRHSYPDTYLLLTNSLRGDLEAFLTRCGQRFGMVRPGKRRPLLTDPFDLSRDIDETQMHQTSVWEMMARRYGLEQTLDYRPVELSHVVRMNNRVGLICGTENTPEKRWPVEKWRALIQQLLQLNSDLEIRLFGTPADREITNAVGEGFPPARVHNLAGQTNLNEFCDELSVCSVVACNDTGGMHLANMLGTPVVAVFGPTNPVRTGPVFSSAVSILQPEGCPATGGMSIDQVTAERVFEEVSKHLTKL